MRLTDQDLENLRKCYIDEETAKAADIFRVNSLDGREIVGRKGGGNYSGLVFPIRWPGDPNVLAYRLRLDTPMADVSGRQAQKYMVARGTRNRFYMPLADPSALEDPNIDIIFVEGEKKCLALTRAAQEISSNGHGRGKFLAIGLLGVWSFKTTIRIDADENGVRHEVRGPLPDFNRVVWRGDEISRRVFILYDANVLTNQHVRTARLHLAREVESHGGTVYFLHLPEGAGINGIDDLLGIAGLPALLQILEQPIRFDWRTDLARNDKGKIISSFANAVMALKTAPQWFGVLGFNEFAQRTEARKVLPWGQLPPASWGEYEDSSTREWLEHQGIRISENDVVRALTMVSTKFPFHPLREWLDSLVWDGKERLSNWLPTYLQAEASPYVCEISRRWPISAVARGYEPGCKVDSALILEGGQGIGKTTTFRILGGEDWYTDDIAELGTRDAALALHGKWIIELSELAAMSKAADEKIKSFLSRSVDHYRAPYARRYTESPRQCVFGGTINSAEYLRDETGARRFWPVRCGQLDTAALERDRGQIWAEAVDAYKKGEHWWIKDEKLLKNAQAEQEERFQTDAWEPRIEKWLSDRIISNTDNAGLMDMKKIPCTTADVLEFAVHKEARLWLRSEEMRVGVILRRLGWEKTRPGGDGPRRRVYTPTGDAIRTALGKEGACQ
jgi:predicted P-loop ATPase